MRFKNLRNTSAGWTADNKVIGQGEIALVVTSLADGGDVTEMRIGNGADNFSALPAFSSGGGGVDLSDYPTETEVAAGYQAKATPLTNLSALTTAANKLAYYTGVSGAVATTDLTPFARSILDDVDAPTARATLGVGTGTGDVVAANNLADLANAATARANIGAINAAYADGKVANDLTASTTVAPSKTAVASALATKASILDSIDLGTGAIALTSAHANHPTHWAGSSNVTATIDATGSPAQAFFTITNRGTGTITMPGTAAAGYQLTIAPGQTGAVEWQSGSTFYSAIPSGGIPSGGIDGDVLTKVSGAPAWAAPTGGAAVVGIVTAPSGQAVGDTLHASFSGGWFAATSGAYQWQADGVNISGEVSADYVIEDPEVVYRCILNGMFATNGIESDAASGGATGYADTSLRTPDTPGSLNPASDGGTWTVDVGAFDTWHDQGIRGTGSGDFTTGRIVRDHGGVDQTLTCWMACPDRGSGPVLRENGAGGANRIAIVLKSFETKVFDVIGGSATLIATGAGTGIYGGAAFEFSVIGTTVTVKEGSTTICTGTTTITTGTWSGFELKADYQSNVSYINAT